MNGLWTWCAAMYRELVTFLTGVIALALWLLPLLFSIAGARFAEPGISRPLDWIHVGLREDLVWAE